MSVTPPSPPFDVSGVPPDASASPPGGPTAAPPPDAADAAALPPVATAAPAALPDAGPAPVVPPYIPGTSRSLIAPDARELWSVAVAGMVLVVAHLADAGPRLLAPWLPETLAASTPVEGLAIVTARFFPWLLALVVLTVPFSLHWMPRMAQRLLEPSLVAGWVTLFGAAGTALLLGRYGLWPWSWATTVPETGTLLTRFMLAEQYVAVALWLVLACLLVPLLVELFFRFALIEFLRRRGTPVWIAVLGSAVAFGLTRLTAWTASPGPAMQQAAIATLLGVVLGTIAVRGRRGRGLGLTVIAHGTFIACELGVLLRALTAG